MNVESIITIGLSFVSLLLIVNAWFTRETLLRVVKLEVMIQQNAIRQQYVEKQCNENKIEINSLRDRMHSIEGSQGTIIQFLEEIKEK